MSNRHLSAAQSPQNTSAACHGPDLDLLDLAGDLAEVGEWGTASRCNSLSIWWISWIWSDLMGFSGLGFSGLEKTTEKPSCVEELSRRSSAKCWGDRKSFYSRASRDLWKDMGQSSPVSNGALNPCQLWTSIASRMFLAVILGTVDLHQEATVASSCVDNIW